MKAAWRSQNNIWASLRENRADWVPPDITYKDSGELAYWAGCTASFIIPDIAQNAMRIFKEVGVDVAYMGKDEGCCGAPMFMSGQWDAYADVIRRNVEEINRRGIKTLVISCPGCWVNLNHYYRQWAKKLGLEYNVEVRHISELIAEYIRDGRLKFKKPVKVKATWHDPCHIGRHGGIYDPPREVLQAIPGLDYAEMQHNREDGLCCGSVLTRIKEPDTTSDAIGAIRLNEAEAAGREVIYTTCPCCEFQLRVAGSSVGSAVQVSDFTNAVVQALGYETTDSNRNVREIWAVFDKVLKQMCVEGMAGMMKELMPEMMDAMPEMMKKPMDAMKALPDGVQDAMLSLMKPMIPKMMPRMMDAIMPKVLPDVLKYMEEKIPEMPQSMKKLLPELLPQVMAEMMPKLLPKVLPLVIDDMLQAMKG
ncbi:MAG: heterodisulfide reductase-related iron-sulfur binding cluster [Thermacetogeniaceae bacterium]